MTLSDSITSIKSASPKWGDIGDALDIMSETRIVLIARRDTAQTIANYTGTTILFDNVVKEDTDYITYNTGTGVATIVKAGNYLVNGGGYYGANAANATGVRQIAIRASGDGEYYGITSVLSNGAIFGNFLTVTSCRKNNWLVGTTMLVEAYQTSGGNLDLAVISGYHNWLSVIRLFD